MTGFKQYLAEIEVIKGLTSLYEHETYKRIPGTSNSYRQDPANTNTQTQRHAHVYAKLKGGGKELYSVNLSGSGHDGSSGIPIPTTHADYFRSIGYAIGPDNILESLNPEQLTQQGHELILLEDA